MSFPLDLDQFNDINTEDVVYASIVNKNQDSIVKCQSELSSIVKRQSISSQMMCGFCWKVQITIVPLMDTTRYGQTVGRAMETFPDWSVFPDYNIDNKYSVIYRYKKPREQFVVINKDARSTLGSYMPPYSFAKLPIPAGSTFPNGQPFHPNNNHFVTFECLQENVTTHDVPSIRDPWSMPVAGSSTEQNVGGFFAREGILYHDGAADMEPKVVMADWLPSLDKWNNTLKRGEVINVLVHLVIVG